MAHRLRFVVVRVSELLVEDPVPTSVFLATGTGAALAFPPPGRAGRQTRALQGLGALRGLRSGREQSSNFIRIGKFDAGNIRWIHTFTPTLN